MFFNTKFIRIVAIFSIILTVSVFAFADTIRLKNGSIIKGKIVGFGGGKFTLMISDGARQRQMTFSADEVESIAFDSETTPADTGANSLPADKPAANKDNTIITAGQTTKTVETPAESSNTEAEATSTENIAENPPVNEPVKSAPAAIKPIQISVKVLADNTANGWTNSGWVVRKGQRIRIVSSGRVSLGDGRYTTPSGISSLPDKEKLMAAQPTGALIAVIGDDNNEFILVGERHEFVATRDGALFLGVNEGNLNDNSGAFNVTVEIDPATR